MGINLPLLQVADLRRLARCTPASPARSARIAVAVRRARQLHRLPVDHLPGRRRGRRAGVDPGRVLRRALHPVRAEHRRRDLEGGAVGDLRRVPDRLHVRDADRRDGLSCKRVGRGWPPRFVAAVDRRPSAASTVRRYPSRGDRRHDDIKTCDSPRSASPLALARRQRLRAEEVRPRRHRHRDQDRPH